MYLQQLSFLNFKNYTEAELTLSTGVNAFVGNNGAGKTNLLDAVHYLSLCKSYFNPIDSQQIKQGADFFMINGVFEKNGNKEVVACGVKRNQKKQFKRNKKDYQRLADHIGLLPLVMISPYDISIIIEGSEERRKFIDNVISQTDNQYLDELIAYNKFLANRNAMLKLIADTGRYDPDLLAVLDEQLTASGTRIFAKRRAFMESFTPVFNQHYSFHQRRCRTGGTGVRVAVIE
jgi:DNA replication and repair protein RecF